MGRSGARKRAGRLRYWGAALSRCGCRGWIYNRYAAIMISVAEPTGKAVRINITMHQSLLHMLDRDAELQNMSRSSLIEEILLKGYAA